MEGIGDHLTIGGMIAYAFLVLLFIGAGIGIGVFVDDSPERRGIALITGIAVTVILSAITLMLMLWYYNNTASGQRAIKTQESNLNNGISRSVEVYDATGNLIKTYDGKFDIDYDDDRIIFDDEHGKRHVIYYPTGTVIIDEVDGK